MPSPDLLLSEESVMEDLNVTVDVFHVFVLAGVNCFVKALLSINANTLNALKVLFVFLSVFTTKNDEN